MLGVSYRRGASGAWVLPLATATLPGMRRLWLLGFGQFAVAATLRAVGHVEASGLAVTLALWMLGWLAAEAGGGRH